MRDHWGKPKGIKFRLIEAYTPTQNGLTERLNRFLLEIAHCLLFDMKIPKKYWPWAVLTANYLCNCLFPIGGIGVPQELYTGCKGGLSDDLTHLHVWGCKVYYHGKSGDKLEP